MSTHQYSAGAAVASGSGPGSFHAKLDLQRRENASEKLELLAGDELLLSIEYNSEHELVFKRKDHGKPLASSLAFETRSSYAAGAKLAVDLFFDSCLVDVFVDGGRRVFSSCVFPEHPGEVRVRSR